MGEGIPRTDVFKMSDTLRAAPIVNAQPAMIVGQHVRQEGRQGWSCLAIWFRNNGGVL